MNSDISRIPIQSLAAVVSLTDILPELPIPTPVEPNTSSCTLLGEWMPSEPIVSDTRRSELYDSIQSVILRASTDSIDFKDGYATDFFDPGTTPNILTSVIMRNQAVFQTKRGFLGISCVDDLSTKSKELSKQSLELDSQFLNAIGEQNSSPSKKKKKRRKKKHKRREVEDGGDTSGTGGESNSATPATFDGSAVSSVKFDDTDPSSTATYGVVADTSKLSLKIFKRPACESSASVTTANNFIDQNQLKKEKRRKKKNKEKDREHKSRRERRASPMGLQANSDSTICPTVPPSTVREDSKVSITTAASVAVTIDCVSTTTTGFISISKDTTTAVSTVNSVVFPPHMQTTLGKGDDLLFDNLDSTHIPYQQPNRSTCEVTQSNLPNHSLANQSALVTANSVSTVPNSVAPFAQFSLPVDSITNANFPTESHLFPYSVGSNVPFVDPSSFSVSDLNINSSNVASAVANGVCNILDYASDFLQNEMLSSTPPCDNFTASTNPLDDSFISRPGLDLLSSPRSSSLITSHLNINHNVQTTLGNDQSLNLLGGILNSAADTSPSVFMNNFDLSSIASDVATGNYHMPRGLASYLAAPVQLSDQTKSQPQQTNHQPCNANRRAPLNLDSRLSTTASNDAISTAHKPWWERDACLPKRSRKRRKNEVEDLQTWTVNYPGKVSDRSAAGPEERTWDQAIGNYSQVLGERAKRRKRMARQPGHLDPNFVFEHDKEYHHNGDDSDNGGTGVDSDFPGDSNLGSRGLRSGVAQRSYAGMDEDDDLGGFDLSGGTEGARRRRKDDDEPFEVRLKEPIESRFPHLMRKSSELTRKRRERVGFGTLNTNEKIINHAHSTITASFGTEAGSLKRLLRRLQSVLESAEDADIFQHTDEVDDLQSNPTVTNGRDVALRSSSNVPAEALISLEDLSELYEDVAKLNTTHSANQIPVDQLVKFLTLLLLNVRDGSSIVATLRPEEDADEHGSKLWRALAMERVMRSVNAGLTALLLMTANDMPREVYVEDVIERTVHTVRFQLVNCIYPEFDPAYRVENTAKENQSSIKSRRARERDSHKPQPIIHLYHKLVQIVFHLAKLVKMQRLTENLVLSLSSVGLSVFFVENVSELQLAALELVTATFSQYEKYQPLIWREILTSLARLPSSKRNLRSYRLNTEDNIQMLTALAMLLVQSVIVLPTSSDRKLPEANSSSSAVQQNHKDGNISGTNQSNEAQNSSPSLINDEVLVTNSYSRAQLAAHTFLSSFLRKSTVKGEDDYRLIFENFVNDLLMAVNKPEWPAAEVMLSILGSLLVRQFNNKSLDQGVRVASVDYLGTVASTLRRDAVSSQLKENDIDAVIRDLLEGNQSDNDDDDEEDAYEKKEDINEINSGVVKSEDVSPGHANDGKTKPVPCLAKNGLDSPCSSHSSSVTPALSNCVSAKSTTPRPVIKNKKMKKPVDPLAQLDRVQALRDALLDYLVTEDASPTAIYARNFYLAQWLNDCTKETERAAEKKKRDEGVNNTDTHANESLSAADQEVVLALSEQRRQHILYKIRELPEDWRQRRQLWSNSLAMTKASSDSGRRNRQNVACITTLMFHGTLDYEDGCLVCRYLASLRPFSQSFDLYLSQICKLLSESSVAVRTKALRCLSAVVEVDPNVLAREDIKRAVHSRLLDTSTSVREAAVDLLGRFLGCKPELTTQYYPMLVERILDKGVSVRKRVIRILRDICLEQPDFPKIPEVCVKMIRRINDEEGIKKLVNEVFQSMWFSPVRDKDTVKLFRKVMNITDVVSACKDIGYEWFEQFLRSLLMKEECEKIKPVERACKQIVECLVQHIMRLEEISSQNNNRLVACLATLYLITKIRPDLMVEYPVVLQNYLCDEKTSDAYILYYVSRIMEATVPLMKHPNENMVTRLEEDLVKLILCRGKMVVESCFACLGAIINRVSKNYRLAQDCFNKFFSILQRFRLEHSTDPERRIPPTSRPTVLRALFSVGLLCKHFDAVSLHSTENPNVRDQVFDMLMFFTEKINSDMEIQKKALCGLGFLCTRHHDLLSGDRLSKFYRVILQTKISTVDTSKPKPLNTQLELKCVVLENLLNFFLEEEKGMLEANEKWKARQHKESLKEMGDVASGLGSSIAQLYLDDILQTFFSPVVSLRLTALSVITTILRQGLINPVRTVPYLIAMQTDPDMNVRIKADTQLQELNHKHAGFLIMRALQGINLSYRLQFLLYPELAATKEQLLNSSGSQNLLSPEGSTQKTTHNASTPLVQRKSLRNKTAIAPDQESAIDLNTSEERKANIESAPVVNPSSEMHEVAYSAIRGTRNPLGDIPTALNSNLYYMLRVNRHQRRCLLDRMVGNFDDSQDKKVRATLNQMIYVADNLAHFPYQSQEEPLYVIHHIDLMVTISGTNIMHSVRSVLFPELKAALEAEAEARTIAQSDMQLRAELQNHLIASSEAAARNDRAAMEHFTEQIRHTKESLDNLHLVAGSNLSNIGDLRSLALANRETVSDLAFEEEDDAEALLRRLTASRGTALPLFRDAIRTSRACALLLTLKQFLKDLYTITDSKIQRYSPNDSPKLWERPLTRRAGVCFHPTACLNAAATELHTLRNADINPYSNVAPESKEFMESSNIDGLNDSPDELYDGEMITLIRDYLEFRKLILIIDPPGEDDLGVDELNTSATSGQGSVNATHPQLIDNTVTAELPSSFPPVPNQSRQRPLRTLVPQTHNKSSDEGLDSDDSDAGGASRLMLARSAPTRKRKPVLASSRTASRGTAGVGRTVKKKCRRKKRFSVPMDSSGEETESTEESDQTDPEY